MAYKFQLGDATMGGALTQKGDIFATGSNSQITGSGIALLDASGLADDGLINANGSLALSIDNLGAELTNHVEIGAGEHMAIVDGGITKKVNFSVIQEAILDDLTGDIEVSGTSATIQATAVEGTMLNTNCADTSTIEVSSNTLSVLKVPNAITVDNATIALNSGTTYDGSGAKTISIKDGGVDSDALGGDAVIASKIADDAVQPEHLHNDVFGLGLAPNGSTNAIDVQVDDSSIEINSDSLRVKATGITNAMLAGSIANAKLSNSAVTIGSTAVSLGASSTVFAGITQLTASAIRVETLDVNTINSITQTETTLEVADKTIVSALSASSANANGGGLQIGGGANSVGHAAIKWNHAGTALKFQIGSDDQVMIKDGSFLPEGNNDIDLGSSTNKFKDLYIDGTANLDAISFNGTAITATGANLNLLAAGAGSSVALAAGDGLVMFDADDSNNPKKVLMSDITTLVGNSVSTTVQTLTTANPNLTVANGQIVLCNRGSAMTLTLDTPSNHNGKRIVIKKIGSGNVTISANGSENIDGSSDDIVLESANAAVTIVSDGTSYFIV